MAFEYPDGGGYRERPMRSVVTVNAADAYVAACIAGLGIIQAPRTGMHDSLASGRLVEVLPDLTAEPMPVSIVHGHTRSVPKRVRAIMTWLERLIERTSSGSGASDTHPHAPRARPHAARSPSRRARCAPQRRALR
jgi:DNA-binding transcriptional LysR family regulator